jgi:hypothetical protein
MTGEFAQFLTLMIMPIGGLLIGLLMLFVTRRERHQSAGQKHDPSR